MNIFINFLWTSFWLGNVRGAMVTSACSSSGGDQISYYLDANDHVNYYNTFCAPGTELAKPDTSWENDCIRQLLKSVQVDKAYIAANDIQSEGRWTWGSSTDLIQQTDWAEGRAPDERFDCAIMMESGWYGEGCDQNRRFVCQDGAEIQAPTTPAPPATASPTTAQSGTTTLTTTLPITVATPNIAQPSATTLPPTSTEDIGQITESQSFNYESAIFREIRDDAAATNNCHSNDVIKVMPQPSKRACAVRCFIYTTCQQFAFDEATSQCSLFSQSTTFLAAQSTLFACYLRK